MDDVDDAIVREDRPDEWHQEANAHRHFSRTRGLLARRDTRRKDEGDGDAHGTQNHRHSRLSKLKTSLEHLETESEFKSAEPFAEFTIARRVLLRIEMLTVEGPGPYFVVSLSRDDEMCVCTGVRARHAKQRRDHGTRAAWPTNDPERAADRERGLDRVKRANGFCEGIPGTAEEPRVQA